MNRIPLRGVAVLSIFCLLADSTSAVGWQVHFDHQTGRAQETTVVCSQALSGTLAGARFFTSFRKAATTAVIAGAILAAAVVQQGKLNAQETTLIPPTSYDASPSLEREGQSDPRLLEPLIRNLSDLAEEFYRRSFTKSFAGQIILTPRGSLQDTKGLYYVGVEDYLQKVRIACVREMVKLGGLTPTEAQKYSQMPNNLTDQDVLDREFLDKLAPPFFSKYGFTFFVNLTPHGFPVFGSVAVPDIILRPGHIVYIGPLRLQAYQSSIDVRIRLAGPTVLPVPIPELHSFPLGLSLEVGNEITIVDEAYQGDMEEYIHSVQSLLKVKPKLKQGTLLTPKELPQASYRHYVNARMHALYELTQGRMGSMSDDEWRAFFRGLEWPNAVRHEAIHVWDNQHNLLNQGPLGPVAKEIRAEVGAVIGEKGASFQASVVKTAALVGSEVQGYGTHGQDYPWITNRLQFYAWMAMEAHESLGSYDRPIQDFADLYPGIQDRVLTEMETYSDAQWQILYQAIWDELNGRTPSVTGLYPAKSRWIYVVLRILVVLGTLGGLYLGYRGYRYLKNRPKTFVSRQARRAADRLQGSTTKPSSRKGKGRRGAAPLAALVMALAATAGLYSGLQALFESFGRFIGIHSLNQQYLRQSS